VPPVIYKDHRGNRLPSVTSIIGRFKESGGLLYWANQQGLEGKTLDQARAEVTTPGTLAHKAVEDHINGRPETALTGAGEVTEKARNAYAAYLHWEAMNRITFRHTEVSLASEQHAFGGTLDAVGMIGNELILLDWKCANAVYADYLYQLAAYGLLWNENYPDHPPVGGFHLCRFAKEQGDFSHHYFPCHRQNLDPFKRPVHIVPMWSSVAGKMIETVWPGISELRTTAFRTGQYAGMPAPDFGPTIARTFTGKAGRGKSKGRSAASRCSFPSGAGSRSPASSLERSAVSSAPRSIGAKPMANGPTPMCRTKCGRTPRPGSSKNAPRPERCAALSRKRSATPSRKWKVSTPSMARPTPRKSRSRKA
jgi:hypothetical protein